MKEKFLKMVIPAIIFLVFFTIVINVFNGKASSGGGKVTYTKEGKYVLNFSENFKKGLATEDNLGLSILLVADCSGSMYDPPKDRSSVDPKYIVASQSLSEIVSFLEDFYNKSLKDEGILLKLGVLKFDDKVETLFELSEMNRDNFKSLKDLASNPANFTPDGATAIGKALEKGAEILSQSQTIFKSLIVITDGENSSGVDPEKVLSAIVEDRNNKSTEDFPIFTNSILVSFVGFDIESYVFNDLEKIGSRVTSASNKIELIDSLKKIFLADITKLESK